MTELNNVVEQKPVLNPEQTTTPELQKLTPEKPGVGLGNKEKASITPTPSAASTTLTVSSPREIPPIQQKIEDIMGEGLKDIYLSLTASDQTKVKKAGEETADKIYALLQSTRLHITKILKLISEWLAHIPGLNSYFIKQEAAIKTNKIVKLK